MVSLGTIPAVIVIDISIPSSFSGWTKSHFAWIQGRNYHSKSDGSTNIAPQTCFDGTYTSFFTDPWSLHNFWVYLWPIINSRVKLLRNVSTYPTYRCPSSCNYWGKYQMFYFLPLFIICGWRDNGDDFNQKKHCSTNCKHSVNAVATLWLLQA